MHEESSQYIVNYILDKQYISETVWINEKGEGVTDLAYRDLFDQLASVQAEQNTPENFKLMFPGELHSSKRSTANGEEWHNDNIQNMVRYFCSVQFMINVSVLISRNI